MSGFALLQNERDVTGKSRTTAMMSVRHFGLDDTLDEVETGSPHGVVKAEAIRGLVERWRVTPAHTIYVGDAVADVRAAREAGVIAVGAAWAHGVRADDLRAAHADVVFTDAAAFLEWLIGMT